MQRLLGPLMVMLLWPVLGWCQSSDLPAAPNAPIPSAPVPSDPSSPAKPAFALPPPTYDRPTGPAPVKKNGESTCFAPEAGLYAVRNLTVPPALQGQMRSYVRLLGAQVSSDWDHSMPRSAKGAWSPARYVAVRFVVMVDGTHTPPEMTVSSGRELYDGLAVTAVRSHPTFPPLPAGIDHPVGVCLRFGYNTEATGLDFSPHDHTNGNP